MHIDWCLCSCVYRVQACMVALYRNRARYNTNAPHTHTRALKMGANLLLRHDTCTGLGQRGDARILHINKPIRTHIHTCPNHTTQPRIHTPMMLLSMKNDFNPAKIHDVDAQNHIGIPVRFLVWV